MIMPLTPPAERSVLTDFLEREEPTNQVYDYGEPLEAMEVVWPTGEIFRMGSASVNGYPDSPSKGGNPSGPGLDFYRFFQCAQGTMGVVTWTNLKIESIPKMDKILFAPIDDLDYAINFLHRILPRRIGQEVLLLNNVDLAAILAEEWPGDFEQTESHPAPLDPDSGDQRTPETSGRKDRLRRKLSGRGDKKRIPGSEAGREPPRISRSEEQAPADTPQPLACRCPSLEEPGQRCLPESLLPRSAV